MTPGEFDGQTHIVVGAASGICQAAAIRLAELGATVACLDIDEAGAATTEKHIVSTGQTAISAYADVTEPSAVHEAVAGVLREFGSIHGLVNCAGITGATGMKSHEVSIDDFDHVYSVNMRGALIVTQSVIPAMVEKGYGRILHLASISGKDGNEGMAAYSSTKAGLIGLVKVMGKEYARSGVTINALAPAVILTPILDTLPDSQIQYMTAKIPMGRTGTLSEVSNMISWIVSGDCSFVTGFTFDMSGGRAVY